MNVLIADTDKRFCRLLEGMLLGEGSRVVCVHSVAAAASEIAGGHFDALVSAFELPDGGVAALRERVSVLPPVAITSSRVAGDARVEAVTRELSQYRYFQKPVPLFDLLDHLRTWGPRVPGPVPESAGRAGKVGPEPSAGQVSADSEQTPGGVSRPHRDALRERARQAGARAAHRAGRTRTYKPEVAGPSAPAGGAGQDGALLLAKVWAERLSGEVAVLDEHAEVLATVEIQAGGPVTSAAWVPLRSAIQGAKVRLSQREVSGRGDWTGMGTLLAECLREPARADFVRRFGSRTLLMTSRASCLSALPLSLGLRDLLANVEPGRSLESLVREAGLGADDVGVEMHLLYRLGIIRLVNSPSIQSPVASSVAPSRAEPSLAARAPSVSQRPHWREVVSHRDDTITPASLGASSRVMAARDMHSEPPTHIPDRSATQPNETSSAWGSGPSAWSSRPSRSARRRTVRSGVDTFQALSGRQGRQTNGSDQSSERRLQRLRRELESLRASRPHVVLAIPQDADLAMVERGRERMLPRYESLLNDPNALESTRQICQEILGLVDSAYGTLRALALQASSGKEEPTTPDEVTDVRGVGRSASEEERFLAMGREYLLKKAWHQADRAFSEAKKLVFHDPDILSGLAWARFHNEHFDQAEREEEARDLLLLVETLQPKHADCQRYLAEVLYHQGHFKAARVRARRAMKLRPDDQTLRQLLRQIERQLDE